MEDRTIPTPDQLLAHGGALRSIARSLTGDEHADDIVQESYVAALRQRAPVADLGAWLRGVARKLSFRTLRGEARRRHRESIAASRMETTDEQAEILSQVADEVRRLREPFRTAIVMRYWQGLPPRAITRELGVPLNTVRSRLQTGLAELRQRLDHRNGGRAAWAGPLVLLGAPQTAGAGVGGIGLAVLGAAGLCGVALGVYALDLHPWRVEPVAAVEVADDTGEVAGVRAREPDESGPLARSAVGEQIVSGQCLAYGTRSPLASCRVRFVTETGGAPRRGKWTRCDEQGRFRLSRPPRGRQPSWLEIEAPGRANVRVELDENVETVGEVRLPQGVRIVGTVRDEAGVPITGLRMRVVRRAQMLRRSDTGYAVPAKWGVYEGHFYDGFTGSGLRLYPITEAFAKTDRHGEFALTGGWLGPADMDDACRIENLDRCKFVSLRRLDQGDVLRFDVVMRRPVALPKISGTLTTDAGKPVAGAKVVATSRDWSKVVAHTDARGRFELVKSQGADEADHVTLSMPPIVGAGFATVDPGRSFNWGDAHVRLRARAPVPLTLRTGDRGLDLRAYQLRCFTFVDEDCALGAQYTAERTDAKSADRVTFRIARGISHLVLVGRGDAAIYLGLHGDRSGELRVARHRVDFRAQDESAEPLRMVYLDLMGNFTDCAEAPFLTEACDDMPEPLTPVLRTGEQGECTIVLGFAPEQCAVRFTRGRKSVLLESIPKARPVIVKM